MPNASDFRGWAGRAHGWRYLAQRIDGTGPAGAFLDNELPLHNVKLTDVLSGPPQLTGVISPVALRDLAEGEDPTILKERGVLIHAECDNEIRGSFLLMGAPMSGPDLSVDASGLTTVAKGMAYPGSVVFSEVDPLDVVRHFWEVIQSDPDSNVALQLDMATSTPVRVGGPLTPLPDASGTSSSGGGAPVSQSEDQKPLTYNWWSTHDIGGEIDKLAQVAPFEYHERHTWNFDKTQVLHYLEFGYPSIGRRRGDLRFVVGENIQTLPDLSRDGDEFANHVVVLGAGEGSSMIRAEARRRDGRVRTMVTLDDKSITSEAQAQQVARLELARRQQLTQVTDVAIRNTSMAPYGSFVVGDEIRVAGMTDWAPFDIWARVTSLSIAPDVPDMMVASLLRSDWVA